MIHIYDSENHYQVISSQTHHSSTITALQFTDSTETRASSTEEMNQIDLISSGADRNLIMKRLDKEILAQYSQADDMNDTKQTMFKLAQTQICKDKILSMDVSDEG